MVANPIKPKKVPYKKPDGTIGEKTVYWFRTDVGTHPVTGKRKQVYKQFDKQKDAKEEYAKIRVTVDNGTYVHDSNETVAAYLERWTKNKTRDRAENTKRSYWDSFRPVRELLGTRTVQSLKPRDVENVIEWMSTIGRKIGGKAGTPLGPRSIQMTISHLRSALSDAVDEGLLVRNPAAKTRTPAVPKKKLVPWTADEVKTFLRAVREDRLYAVMRLSLTALRPEEVCGLKWSVVDLRGRTLTIDNVRTMVAGQVDERAPKTEAGERTLPLDDVTADALELFGKLQSEEQAAAGDAYKDSGYVLVDELGRPVQTDWLRRRFKKLVDVAGVRSVRLYDARHACLTYLATSGVPDVVIAAWAGHSDPAFTKRVYVHPNAEDLAVARDAVAKLLD
jgi:integrase